MSISKWMRRLAGGSSRARKARGGRLRKELYAELCVTQLETRRVLNGDGVASELVVDAGQDAGDGQSDSFRIELNEGQIEVSVNGELTHSVARDAIDSITVYGSSDNDSIVADLGDGLLNGIDINLQGGSGDDSVRVITNEYLDSLIHSISNAVGHSGAESQIGFNQLDPSITLGGIENVDYSLSTAEFVIQTQGGFHDITVDRDTSMGRNRIEILDHQTGDAGISISFASPDERLRIDTVSPDQTAGDSVVLDGLADSFDADLIISGDGADSFHLRDDIGIGSGDVTIASGNVRIDGMLSTSHADIRFDVSDRFHINETGGLTNDFGSIHVEAEHLDVSGSVLASGGSVVLDSGDSGTTLLSGRIDASDLRSGQSGGSVHVLGMHVGLTGDAQIDVSGDAGGGVALIGGDYQGSNTLVRNAHRTFVGDEVVLIADAISDGDGGKIIVWGDDWTKFYGTIFARGGTNSGDGGFAEVSGKVALDFRGSADLSAAQGGLGDLLLDPTNISIETNATNDDGELPTISFADGGATDYVIQPSAFDTIDANITLEATNNITFTEDVEFDTDGKTITLRAGNDIILEENVNLTTSGGVTHFILHADADGSGDGEINLEDGSGIDSSGGDIDLIADNFDFDSGSSIAAGAGDVGIVTSIVDSTDPNYTEFVIGSSNLSESEIGVISTSGTLTIGEADGSTAHSVRVQTSGTNVTIGSSSAGTLQILANEGVYLADDLTANQELIVNADVDADGGTLTIEALADLQTANHAITVTAGTIDLQGFVNPGEINSGTAATTIIDSGDGIGFGDASSTPTNGLHLSDANLDNITAGSLTLRSPDNIFVNGVTQPTSISGTVTLETTQNVTFTGSASTFTSLDVQGANTIAVDVDVTTTTGDLTLNAVNAISFADAVTLDSAGSLDLDSTNSTLTGSDNLTLVVDDVLMLGAMLSVNTLLTITDGDGDGIQLGGTDPGTGELYLAGLSNITTTDLTLSTSGNITVEGITQPGTITGTVSLDTTQNITFTGSASTFSALDIQGVDSINVNVDLTTTTGDLTLNAVNAVSFANNVTLDSAGSLNLDSTNSTLTGSDNLTLIVDDVLTLGAMLSVNTLLTITDGDGDGIQLGGADPGTGELFLADLSNITTTNLTLGSAGDITVDGITQPGTITGTVSLDTTQNITFTGSASTFSTLDIQGVDSINVDADLTTTVGDLTLNAVNAVSFADAVTLDSAGSLNLDSTNSTLTGADNLTLVVDDVLTLGAMLSVNTLLTITDGDGDGIQLGGVDPGTGQLYLADLNNITTTDLTLSTAGNITVEGITQPGTITGTVSLDTTQNITFTGSASTFSALDIQGVDSINVNVDLTTTTGDLTLNAVNAVSFANNVTLDSAGSLDLDSTNSTLSGGNNLTLVVDDTLTIGAMLSVSTLLTITDGDGDGIQLGGADPGTGELYLADLSNITTTNLTLGTTGDITVDGITQPGTITGTVSLDTTQNITFTGGASTFSALDIQGVDSINVDANLTTTTGDLTLNAVNAVSFGNNVTLDSAGSLNLDSTNSTLIGSDNLTLVVDDVLTLGAMLSVNTLLTITDGDGDGIQLGGADPGTGVLYLSGLSNITTTDLTLSTSGDITVEGITQPGTITGTVSLDTTQNITFTGSASTFSALDIQGVDSINVNVDLTTTTGDLTLNALNAVSFANNVTLDSAGSLDLDSTNSTLSGGNNLTLVVDDTLTIGAMLSVSTLLTITDGDGDGIQLGGADPGTGELYLADLSNITTTNLTLSTAGDITVDGITQPGTITGTVDLDTTQNITFTGGASTFSELDIQGVDSIGVDADLTTTTGDLTLNAVNAVSFGNNVTIDSAGSLNLDSINSTLIGSDNLTVVVDDVLTLGAMLSVNSLLTITDGDGDGIQLGGADPGTGELYLADLSNITTTDLTLGSAGNITVEGITQPGTITGTVSLDTTQIVNFTGTASTFTALDVQGADSINVNVDLTTTTGDLTLNALNAVSFSNNVTLDSAGSLDLDSTNSTLSGGNNLTLVVDDTLTIGAMLSVSTLLTITDGDGDGIQLGGADPGTGELYLADLSNITTTNLTLGTAGDITVDGITQPGTITGTVDLDTTQNITFTGGASSFSTLDIQGVDSIGVDADLTTTTGDLTLNAINAVSFGNNVTIDSAGSLNLDSINSTLIGSDNLTLVVDDVLTLGAMLSVNSLLTITDGDGDGIQLGGADPGTGELYLADLSNITTTDLTLGSAGNITVEGITQPGTITGTVSLDTTQNITFTGSASTFTALDVQGADSINVNVDLTTTTGDLILNALNAVSFANNVTLDSAGSLDLDSTNSTLSGGNNLTLVVDDTLTIGAMLSVSTLLTITDGDGDGIQLGGANPGTGELYLAGLNNITTTNLTLSTAGDITVDGITQPGTITGTVSLGTTQNITFTGGASTFSALDVQGVDTINVDADLTTTTGDLTLNAVNAVSFGNNVTLDSAGSLDLDSANSTLIGSDNLTLVVDDVLTLGAMLSVNTLLTITDGDGDGIQLGGINPGTGELYLADLNNITSPALVFNSAGNIVVDGITAGDVTLNATGISSTVTFENNSSFFGGLTIDATDGVGINSSVNASDSVNIDANAGLFSIAAGGSLTTSDDAISITADDVALSGSLSSGTGVITLTDSDGGGIGLESAVVAGRMNLSQADLNNVNTSGGLELVTSGGIVVNGIASPTNLTGLLTLDAGTTIDFSTASSSFHSITAQAGGAISVDVDLTTTSGDLTLEATGAVTFADNVTLDSAGSLFLDSTASTLNGADNLTLIVDDALTLGAVLSVNTLLTITDGDGDGIQLGGADPGTGELYLADLGNIATSNLTLSSSGDITVDGITQPGSITGTVDLDTTQNIAFTGAASTFSALEIQGVNSVAVDVDLTTTTGDLTIAATNSVTFADNVMLDSAGSLLLDSTSGNLSGADNLTLVVDDALTLGAMLSVNALLTIADGDGDGIQLGGIDPGTGELFLSDLSNITTTNLTLSSAGDITVDGITQPGTITGTVDLDTTQNITFSGAASTFSALDIQGVNSVAVDVDLTTTTGDLTINATNAVTFGDNVTIDSAGSLHLDSTNSNLTGGDSLTLVVDDTLTLGSQLSVTTLLTITDGDGDGVQLGGADPGTGELFLADLSNIATTNLTLGSTGDITVDGITQPAAISGNVTLDTNANITFSGNTSSFRTLTVDTAGTVSLDVDLSTTIGDLSIAGDTAVQFADDVTVTSAGALFLDSANGSLTGGANLTLVVNDALTLGATLSVSSLLSIVDGDADGIGFGATTITDGLNLADADLNNISTPELRLETSGAIIVDAVSQPSGIDAVTLDAVGSNSTVSFQTGNSSFDVLNVNATSGVNVETGVTSSDTISIDADSDDNGTGDLTVTATGFVDSTNNGGESGNAISISANDVVLSGTLNSGSGLITIADSDGGGIGLESTEINGRLNVSQTDLDNIISSGGLTLETSSAILVDGVSTSSNNLTGLLTLDAGTSIEFSGVTSSFRSLDAQADTSISVDVDLSTTAGDLTLSSDVDDNDGNGISFAAGIVVESVGEIILNTTGDTMTGQGELALDANDGVTLNGSLTTSGDLLINADVDANDNNGTLTVASGTTLSSGGNVLTITANDLDIQGSVTSGGNTTTLIDSDGDGVGLGDSDVTNGLNLSGTDLQAFTANGLTVSTTGSMLVDNVTQPGTITGTTDLIANGSNSTIQFNNNASSFDALSVSATEGVAVNVDLTVNGVLSIVADSDANDNVGTLFVTSGVTITSDGDLTVTANDLNSEGSFDSGTGGIFLNDSDGTGVGLGSVLFINGFSVSQSELDLMTSSSGLTVETAGDIWVDNVTQPTSITGTTTLNATGDVNFANTESTFESLVADADAQVNVQVDLTTSGGDLLLSGNAGGTDDIRFSGGVQVSSGGSLTLDVAGESTAVGVLGLSANDGVTINQSLTSGGALTINADGDAGDDDGSLTVAIGATINTSDNALEITANQLDLSGDINSGAAMTTLIDSDAGGIGLGNASASNGLEIDSALLAHVTSTGLTLQTEGDVAVDGFDQPASVGGTLLINAQGVGSTIVFENGDSTFDELQAVATGDINVDANVASATGDIQMSAGGAFDVSAGNRVVAGGDGTSIDLSGSTVEIGEGFSGTETIRNAGTGTVTLTSTAGDVILDDDAIGGESGLITVNSAGSIDEAVANSNTKVTTTGTLSLNATGAIGSSGTTGAFDVDVDSLTASGSGVFVNGIGSLTLSGVTSTDGDVEVFADDVIVDQFVTSTGVSSVTIEGDTVTFNANGDVTAGDDSSNPGFINVDTTNDSGLVIANGTIFKTSAGQVSGALINSTDPFDGTDSVGDPLSDSNRFATIAVLLQDSQSTNVGIQINWGEGDTDESDPQVGNPPGDDRAFVVDSFVTSSNAGTRFTHNYLNPPDPNNPSADITISLVITDFADSTINLSANGSSVLDLSQFDERQVVIEVADAITPFLIPLPETERSDDAVRTRTVSVNLPETRRLVSIPAPQVINNSIGTTQQVDATYYVLRIVTFGSEGEVILKDGDQEYRLPDMEDPDSEEGFELSQLPELFKRLPDDRYRIYLIEGQTERLVLDFIIRDGQPIEAQSDDEVTAPVPSREEIDETDHDAPTQPTKPTEDAQSNRDRPLGFAERLGSVPIVSTGSVLFAAGMDRSRRPRGAARRYDWNDRQHGDHQHTRSR